MHYFYQDKWRFQESLKELGIEWDASTFEHELIALRRRIETHGPTAGLSLSEDEQQGLTFWIEQRIDAEVRRVVEACLRRLLM